jgi:hypothetical protein
MVAPERGTPLIRGEATTTRGSGKTDLRRRVERLLAGRRSLEDLQRIYLDLRDRAYGRASVLEIGDFVAHRDERVKGVVTRRVEDLLLSGRTWIASVLGERLSLESPILRDRARANLRLATDEQIRARLGLKREVAKSALERGLKALSRKERITEREAEVLVFFGTKFIWNPAFTDDQLFDDLVAVLIKNGALAQGEIDEFRAVKVFNTLFAITQMHGSTIVAADGTRSPIYGFGANSFGRLEVKGQLSLATEPKPITAELCMFWSGLDVRAHCRAALLGDPATWVEPLDVIDGQFLDFL